MTAAIKPQPTAPLHHRAEAPPSDASTLSDALLARNAMLRPSGYKQSTLSIILSTLAINILALALPIMTLQVYDRVLPNAGSGTLPVLIGGVCVAILLETALRLCRAYVIGRSGAAYEHRLGCEAMDKVLHADLSRMRHYGIGEHLHRMGAVGKVKDFYNGQALTTIIELGFVPLFLGLIIYIANILAVVPAVILGLFIALSFTGGKQLRQALLKRQDADDTRFNFLVQALEGVHTLKSFALEPFFSRRYEALEEQSTLANYQVTQETSHTFNTGALFSHIMVASVITFGASCVLEGMLTTGALIATLLLSGRMMQPIQKALSLWTRYQDYLLACQHLEEIFTTPQMAAPARASHEGANHVASQGLLQMKHVTFQGDAKASPLLANINLSLSLGDTVLIDGAHGTGKTALLNLIAGIFPPDSGSIFIDGYPVEHFTPEQLSHHIGFIRSDALIFRGSIRDNITSFGQADEQKAREVSALLGVDKDVTCLPGGLDTFLSGNDTDTIPASLKQRIAMVRALATKPKLVLFDNSDRFLDKAGYASTYSLLARLKGHATMVLVSDDHNIQALAEDHFELQQGTLVPNTEYHSRGNVRPFKELRL